MDRETPATAGVMQALRAATAAAHRALEARPLLRAIAAGPPSRAAYVGFLQSMAAVHGAVEAALSERTGRPVSDVWRRDAMRRMPALVRDLAVLDARPPPPGVPPASLREPAALLGALYVLEGSRLGGLVLRGAVARTLPVEAGRGLAYLGMDERGVRARWVGFGRRMDAALVREDERRRAADGALDTFAWIGRLLDVVPAP